MSLLPRTAPGLSQQLRSASSAQRTRALVKASEALSHSVRDLEPSIQALIKAGLEDETPSIQQLTELNDYAEAADDRYFTLQEDGGDETIWKNWFAKARLATALAGIFGDDALEAAENAAYELCFVEEDNSRAISLMESALKTETGK